MKQDTIDGNIEEINFMKKEKSTIQKRLTIKEKFRLRYGYNEEFKCKDCKFFIRIDYNDKHYYKCEIMGISSSTATDIRLKDYGCQNFVIKEKK